MFYATSISKWVRTRINLKSYGQWIGAFAGFSLLLEIGIMSGWISPNIVRLTSEDAEIRLTNNEVSWIVSISFLTGLIGAILGLISMEWIGGRYTAILSFLMTGLSWISLIVANSIEWIFTGLVLSGVATGLVFSCAPKFLGDISAVNFRGTVIALSFSGVPIGIVIGTFMETYLPMRISSSIYLIHCLLSIIYFLWLRDSPYELVRKGKMNLAQSSIKFYIPNANFEKELSDIKGFLENNDCQNIKDQLKLLKTRSVRKSFILILIIFAVPYISGLMNIMSYVEVILIKGKFDIIKPADFVIYTRIWSAIFTFLISSLKLLDTIGRKITLIITSIGISASLVGLGLHFYLLSLNFDSGKLQWLPMTTLLLYFMLYSFAYVTVPNALLSEVFPERIKSIASFIVTTWIAIIMFLTTKFYQPLVDLVGETYIFWVYAILSLLNIPIALFLLPETKGKTFQNIQDDLSKK